MKRAAIAVIVGIAAPLVLAYSGLSVRLGAHPWWAQSSAWIGALIGLAIALALLGIRLNRVAAMVFGAVIVLVGALAAHSGKTAFANSYAEDALAGRFWYWGWIGGLAGLTLLVITMLWPSRTTSPILAGSLNRA